MSGTVVNTVQVFAVVVCVVPVCLLVCQDSRGGAMFVSEALARQYCSSHALRPTAALWPFLSLTSYRHYQVPQVYRCKCGDFIIRYEVTVKNVGSSVVDFLYFGNTNSSYLKSKSCFSFKGQMSNALVCTMQFNLQVM